MGKQVYRNLTKPIRACPDWHYVLKIKAAEQQRPIWDIIEDLLVEHYSKDFIQIIREREKRQKGANKNE